MAEGEISILFVDDDPHACEIFSLVMTHHKLPATVAQDAETALEYLSSHECDVVLIDLFLPKSDGYQLLQNIREARLAPNSKMVATTAYHTNDTAQEVQTRGFDGFLPKPFDVGELVAYLQSVVKC